MTMDFNRTRYIYRNGVEISVVHMGDDPDYPYEAWVMKGRDNVIADNNRYYLKDAPLPVQPMRYSSKEMAHALHLWTYHMYMTDMENNNG